MPLHPKLCVHFANILDVDADCIENAANEDLLSGGGIEHLIHQVAGLKLTQYCFKLPPNSQRVCCSISHSVITPNLKSKYQFLIILLGRILISKAIHNLPY